MPSSSLHQSLSTLDPPPFWRFWFDFFFFKIRSRIFRKFHHLTLHPTVIQGLSSSSRLQLCLLPANSHLRVANTRYRVSFAVHTTCHHLPLLMLVYYGGPLAPTVGVWSSRANECLALARPLHAPPSCPPLWLLCCFYCFLYLMLLCILCWSLLYLLFLWVIISLYWSCLICWVRF